MKSLSLSLFALVAALPAAFALDVAPTDSALRYVGRFDRTEPAGPRCTWSASSVAFTVSGGLGLHVAHTRLKRPQAVWDAQAFHRLVRAAVPRESSPNRRFGSLGG
jgi:hypothetical protein